MNPCISCKGACCKTSPGATVPEDWGSDRLTIEARLNEAFQTGRWCVALPIGLPPWQHMPYVMPKPRENGWCQFLTPTGCEFREEKDRPRACRDFIASEQFPHGCHYPVEITLKGKRRSEVYYASKWAPYRQLLVDLAMEFQEQ